MQTESGKGSTLINFIILYHSPNIARAIKFRRLTWAGHVARLEEGRTALKILTGKPTRKRPLGKLGIDGRTILEWTLKK